MRFFYQIIISFLLFFIVNTSISAQERNSSYLKVDPAYIDVSLEKPNEEKKISIVYTNQSNQSITLDLSPIDFKQQGEHGEIGFVQNQEGSYSYSLSSFLSLESSSIELAPGEKRTFNVSIKNREDLSPGGHYAAVIATLRQGESNVPTAIAPSVSTAILLRKVGGERFNLSLVNVDWPKNLFYFSYPKNINLTFQNEGNIHLIPYGKVTIYDMFGHMIQKGIINTSSFIVFPETRRYIPIQMNNVSNSLPFSINTITVQGQDSIKKINYLYRETYVYINPLFLAVIVAIIVFLLIIYKRKKRNTS